MDHNTQRRAIGALIFTVQEAAPISGELALPHNWRDKVDGKAVLFDRRGEQDVLRIVTQEEAIEFGQRQRAVERELGPGPGRDHAAI